MTSSFSTLAAVIEDPSFPEADVALRRGRHVGRHDGALYELLVDGRVHLESFYDRYGCELCSRSDGYFFLRPKNDTLGGRQLSVGEMLVGQVCALMALDPSSLSGAPVKREAIIQRLDGLVGRDALIKALCPKVKHLDRIGEDKVRHQVRDALRRLESLGFVDVIEAGEVGLRDALMRFTDPVRATYDVAAALERLVTRGEVVFDTDDADGGDAPVDGADDDAGGEEETP